MSFVPSAPEWQWGDRCLVWVLRSDGSAVGALSGTALGLIERRGDRSNTSTARLFSFTGLVRFERTTHRLGGGCSILLSYSPRKGNKS